MHSQYLITLLVILFLSKFYNHESPVLDYCSVGSKPHNGNYIYSQMTKSQVKTDSVLEPWQGAEHVKSSSCWTKNRRNKMCACVCVCVCNWQNKQTKKQKTNWPSSGVYYIYYKHSHPNSGTQKGLNQALGSLQREWGFSFCNNGSPWPLFKWRLQGLIVCVRQHSLDTALLFKLKWV